MYYFASDVHLGTGDAAEQRITQELFVKWLDRVSYDASTIFLCGDIFDFWYEYHNVVPKGYVRVLSKIAQITEKGVRVVFMAGNHDLWVRDYFTSECGMEVYTKPQIFDIAGKKIFVAHGDNLNVKGSPMLKLINTTFRSKIVKFLFSWLVHPDLAMKFGKWWSSSSRKKHTSQERIEYPVVKVLETFVAGDAVKHPEIDCYIFGHSHYAKDCRQSGLPMMMTSDWKSNPYYIKIDQQGEIYLNRVEDITL